MKKLAFIALFAMISVYFVGCGINEDSIPTPSSEDYSHLPECQNKEDKIKGCLLIDSDESGKFRNEMPFKNGKVNGMAREYFADKTICETQFVDNIAMSTDICFDKDGKLKNGAIKEYYDDDNLAFEYTFKDGRKEGVAKSYYANGNIQYEVIYKNGKREGARKGYYDNGNLAFETPYKNGKINGINKGYHKNGKPIWEVPYQDSQREGEAKWYHKNGSLRFIITFENDKAISGKCGNGKEIESQKLSEFNGWDISVLGCD
ncbi:hypothetical protein CCZ01_04000 [Helicobacter monodelphidis]|uniref:toxin-antitoxin system YwqK family antitoxin n=1 Tax=Helicobacter sp. 15-1451 TaxID=2004995 RepID=UPI000DCE08D1|nr:toxin-antitoxin system YwqK family antitoxin [Helicobacter sp. 15-1451]RAX58243.1 hypothetical protein CCZ01_04000 [Helicobacter sp. 15-1451]